MEELNDLARDIVHVLIITGIVLSCVLGIALVGMAISLLAEYLGVVTCS